MQYLTATYYDEDSNVVAMHGLSDLDGKIIFVENMLNHGIRHLSPIKAQSIVYAIYTWESMGHAHVYDMHSLRVRGDNRMTAGWTWVNSWLPEDPAIIAEINLHVDKGAQA